jgi:AraC-like DNA-binding protein
MISGHMGHPTPAHALPLFDSFAEGGELCVLRSADQRLMTTLHRHPHGELFLIRAGYLKSQSETGHWLIPAGQICWIPPGSPHGAENSNVAWTRLHLAASLDVPLPAHPCVWTSTPLIRALIDKVARAPGVHERLSPADRRLVAVLIDELAHAQGAPILLPMPRSPSLRAAAEQWQRSPGEMGGLDVLAVEAGVSRRTLTRTFRSETGLSVGRWRQLARFMHGIELLLAGVPVTDVAMSLGYDSTSSFVALCQRHTGMSPSVLAETVPLLPN